VDSAPVPDVPGRDAGGSTGSLIEIDTLTAGISGVTVGYLIDAPRPTLIECGPARSIDAVIDGLRAVGMGPDDLAHVVVTHVHLDHAGGAGDLLAAFPSATVVVSDLGARHLADPTRLNTSARTVYGPLFDRVYGPCTPIAAGRIVAVGDGHRLDLGGGHVLELLHTPGHAKHHLAVLDASTGDLFTGDSVGVRLEGMRTIRPATPPADFHLGASLATLARYRALAPTRLHLAHYGPVDPPQEALAEAEERLRAWTNVAEAAYHESEELDHIVAMLTQRFADELAPDTDADDTTRRRLAVLNDVRSNAAGILRYLARRDDGTLTPTG
jgi:glyoxylase-like metal-dependent hydrolase (beta-lactamase superfamily II)